MTAALPDVSLSDLSSDPAALDWVGMQGIDLPITLNETGQRQTVHARADLQVDLPRPEVKGIHMSRLYTLLDRLGQDRALATPVQTAVKRADEQAFAALNGANLMFVEDAARRLGAALSAAGAQHAAVHVRHIESLHPHDAVASAGAHP